MPESSEFLSIDNQSAMSNYVIPEDCWPEILKLLPVKSLARFRCVCRRWNALICSSSFIADHLASSKSKPRLFINDVYYSGEKSCVIFDSDSSSAATYNPRIMPKGPPSYRLVGSAKGIICFYVDHEDYSGDIVLWNPVINKYIMLPKTHTHPTFSSSLVPIAIGVKPSEENDLRVLALHPHDSLPNAAQIYSVRQGAWRVLHLNIPSCAIYYAFEVKSCVNGAVYWVALDNPNSYMLIRFGFEEEEFSCITLPNVFADSRPYDLHVGVYCGRLALFQRHYHEELLWKIWTRGGNEEDSWSVIISFDPADFIHGITHNGQILVSRTDNDKKVRDVLVLYNPTSRSWHHLDMQVAGLVDACPFVESLVFMDGEGGAVSPRLL